MAKIAELAGVSKATVSRALGGSSLIGDDVRAHVGKVADELGYLRRTQKGHAERSILTEEARSRRRRRGSPEALAAEARRRKAEGGRSTVHEEAARYRARLEGAALSEPRGETRRGGGSHLSVAPVTCVQ